MSWHRELANKLSHLRNRNDFDDSLREELLLHIEERADELQATGLTYAEARAIAQRELGSRARIAESSREAWRVAWLEDLGQDLRYAVRALRRDRGLAITAILSLALGIGLNTAIFSLTAEFLFSQPSVRDPDSLARVEIAGGSSLPLREYRLMRDAKVFDDIAGMNPMQEINWRTADGTQRIFVNFVTDNFFDVTGVPLAFGRPIRAGERDTVVISHRFWQSRLNADPNVLGRTLVLDRQTHTIVGVLPAVHRTLTGFAFIPDMYLPVTKESTRVAMFGRMRAQETRATVAERLKSACAELDRIYPDEFFKRAAGVTVSGLVGVERLTQGFLRSISSFFALMMAAAGLLLLIACANVASLLLARASTRSQEFAIRMSIGAGRGRLIRQLLAESLMLSVIGTTAGLILNYSLTRFINRAVIHTPFPMKLAIEPDWRLLGYAALIAIATAAIAGLVPALTSSRAASVQLKRDEHQVSGRRATLRNALVAGQLALSVLVLIMAALSVRNLIQSAQLDPGFDLHRTVWAQMRFISENYPDTEKLNAAVKTAAERARNVPGVQSASFAMFVPLNDHFLSRNTVFVTGFLPNGGRFEHAWNAVGPDYFKTMGIKIIAGREFSPLDDERSPRAVIINETLARKAFGTSNPIGQRIRFSRDDKVERYVVGVARNSKYSTIGERDRAAIYESYMQIGSRPMVQFLVAANGSPESLLKPLSAELLTSDPSALVELKPMNRALAFALLPSQVGAFLLGTIGLLGLVLAAVGLFGVLSYSIDRRTREIGLRVALGAHRGHVLKLVMREGAWIVCLGLGIGVALAILVTRPLARFLVPGLEPTDPLTYVAVGIVLICVAILASLTPTLRALRVDPMVALRHL